jgi:hypothetical protein
VKKTIVFILGTGRNGSTLLDMALNSHTKVFSVGEMDHLEGDIQRKDGSSMCGCYTPIGDCQFWNKVWNSIKNKYQITENPFYYKGRQKQFSKLIRKPINGLDFIFALLNVFPNRPHRFFSKIYKEEIFDHIFEENKVFVVSDSMKSFKRALRISNYLKNNYNFKFIHLVRDGRAVVYSYSKKSYTYYLKDKDNTKVKIEVKKYFDPQKLAIYIKAWKRTNKQIQNYFKFFRKDSYLLLKYEALCSLPEEELKRVCNFIGMPYEKEMLRLDRFENHIIRGNPTAKFKAKSFLPPNMDFMQHLDDEELALFNDIAGNLNKSFGY